MDALGLPFVLVCLIAWFGFVLLTARICGRNERLARAQRLAELQETQHPFASITSISEYMASQQARSNRALLAQRDRWSRGA